MVTQITGVIPNWKVSTQVTISEKYRMWFTQSVKLQGSCTIGKVTLSYVIGKVTRKLPNRVNIASGLHNRQSYREVAQLEKLH